MNYLICCKMLDYSVKSHLQSMAANLQCHNTSYQSYLYEMKYFRIVLLFLRLEVNRQPSFSKSPLLLLFSRLF